MSIDDLMLNVDTIRRLQQRVTLLEAKLSAVSSIKDSLLLSNKELAKEINSLKAERESYLKERDNLLSEIFDLREELKITYSKS